MFIAYTRSQIFNGNYYRATSLPGKNKIVSYSYNRLTLNTTNIFVYPTFMMTFLIDDDQDFNKSWAGGSFGIKSYS